MASSGPSGHTHHQTRPAELFRSDLISAMKLPDSHQLEPNSFVEIRESWRTEWEIGVQVCVTPNQLPEPSVKVLDDTVKLERDEQQLASQSGANTQQQCVSDEDQLRPPQYDLDELDLTWLESINQKRKYKSSVTEEVLKNAVTVLETKCQHNMTRAVATEKGLGIEYDDTTVCDVCRDPDREDTNEMIFCDSCDVCIHQACYGVTSIPRGSWLCRPCSAQLTNVTCVLCPNTGGAFKRIRPGPGWAHMSCALWIPEVKIGSTERMEPITNIEAIPTSRWNLICCICRKKQGACIQCSFPSCVAAYHITCAFRSGLKMISSIHSEHHYVMHESYCPKHTAIKCTPGRGDQSSPSIRTPAQLRMVEETFYEYTNPEELRGDTDLPAPLCSLLYNYWKLKRRAGHNKPLLPGLPVETALHSLRKEMCTETTVSLSKDEHFPTVIHLRQNLEKVRTLIYMIQRRERLKRQLLGAEMEVLHCELLQEPPEPPEKKEPQPIAPPPVCSTAISSSSSSTTTNTRLTRSHIHSLQPNISLTRLSGEEIKELSLQKKISRDNGLKRNNLLDSKTQLDVKEEPLQRRRLRSSLGSQDDLDHVHKKNRKLSDSLTSLSSRYVARNTHMIDKRVAV